VYPHYDLGDFFMCQIQQKLNLIKQFTVTDNLLTKLCGSFDVVSKKWYDPYKQDSPTYWPLDLYNVESWGAYSGCIKSKIKVLKTTCRIEVQLFDGDFYDGRPTTLRWEAVLSVPCSTIIKVYENEINYEYECFLDKAVDEYESKRLLKIKTDLNKEFMKGNS
jgi:hypothetical protein